MSKAQQPNLIFPFTSEKFMEIWDLWKTYKKETFGFVYKGVFSEQMTLKKLTELSNGEEERAIRIIEQSIMQQWQGLFPLHIPKFKDNGNNQSGAAESTPKKPKPTQPSGSLRERVQAAVNKRYGNGQPPAGGGDTQGF
jgi:hypothetical protein